MKRVKELRSVIAAAILGVGPVVNDLYLKAKIQKKFEATDPDLVLGLSFILIIFLSFFLMWIFEKFYDKYLWRLFFKKNDLSGYWYYANEYEDKSIRNTTGFTKIEQSPDSVKLISGISTPTNPHVAAVKTVIADFEDEDTLINCYEVKKYGANQTSHLVKRSLQTFDIERDVKGRPYKMSSKFWNCMRDAAQETEAKRLGGWPLGVGTAVYLRVSKKEYEDRALSSASQAKLTP